MANVYAATPPRFLRERNKFGCFGISAGSIDKGGTDPQRAFLHRLPNQPAHASELLRRRINIVLAQFVNPDRGCANERRHVRRDPFPDRVL